MCTCGMQFPNNLLQHCVQFGVLNKMTTLCGYGQTASVVHCHIDFHDSSSIELNLIISFHSFGEPTTTKKWLLNKILSIVEDSTTSPLIQLHSPFSNKFQKFQFCPLCISPAQNLRCAKIAADNFAQWSSNKALLTAYQPVHHTIQPTNKFVTHTVQNSAT